MNYFALPKTEVRHRLFSELMARIVYNMKACIGLLDPIVIKIPAGSPDIGYMEIQDIWIPGCQHLGSINVPLLLTQ
jgi:hypothetical protein